jgi:hypothetical protein
MEASVIDHPKFMALSWPERGKWVTVLALAERQLETGGFESRDHLQALLRKEGDSTPVRTVDRLVEVRLLDIEPDGTVVVHDRNDYRADVSTKRVQEFRQRGTLRNVSEQQETPTLHDKTIDNTTERTLHPAPARAPAKGAAVAGNGQPTSMSDLLPNLPFMASGKAPLTKRKH